MKFTARAPRNWKAPGLQGNGGVPCSVSAAGGGREEPMAAGLEPALAVQAMGLEAKNDEVCNNNRKKHNQGPCCKQRRNCLQGDANS